MRVRCNFCLGRGTADGFGGIVDVCPECNGEKFVVDGEPKVSDFVVCPSGKKKSESLCEEVMGECVSDDSPRRGRPKKSQ